MNVNAMRPKRWIMGGFLLVSSLLSSTQANERMRIAWPTPSQAYAEGLAIEDFIQPTVSGLVESGLFGCVRTSGNQFHEALDLFPVERDGRGEPIDEVYAALAGVVRHVNTVAGRSSYGRYVVVEHVDVVPAVYTLYAHLAAVDDGLKEGRRVGLGQVLGTMGRSAGGYTIPTERAHLHFEIGLRLTDDFQRWYNWKRFGSRNSHGVWNGMNLVGIDPLAFYNAFRAEEVNGFAEHFQRFEMAVKIRIATSKVPDFTKRYPSLVVQPFPAIKRAGWEVSFNQFGVPFEWTPLAKEDLVGYGRDEVKIVDRNRPLLQECRCKDLVKGSASRPKPDTDLQRSLQQLFGLKR